MSPVRRELADITRLAVPVAASHLGSMMLWVVDVMMIGRLGVEALDIAALGRLWIMGTLIAGIGVVMGIDPIVSQAHGAGDVRRVGLTLQRGLVMALIVSVPTGLLWLVTDVFLVFAGQDPQLSFEARDYALVQIPGLPFFLLFVALRQYLLGRGIAAPVMWVTFLANGVNLAANWMLIYGNLGFPRLGVLGAGIATSITELFLLIALVLWMLALRLHRGGWAGWSRDALNPRRLWEVAAVGLPIGLQLGLEMWAFVLAQLMAGWLGGVALAGHVIVINLAAISFMIPMGISFGVATRVGNLIGAGDAAGAQRAAWVGLALGGAVMTVSAAILWIGRYWLPTLYTPDLAVVGVASSLLPIAAAFQLSDGIQVVGGGVLRGMGRTRPAAAFNVFGYYLLALPAAYIMAFQLQKGLDGIWWGMTLGLAVISVLLVIWVGLRGPARVDTRIVPGTPHD